MNQRQFSTLLMTALIVAVAIAFLLPSRTGKEEVASKPVFLEEIAAQVNEVDRLVFTAGEGTVSTLVRGQVQWRVAELEGYPADWGKVKSLLLNLAQAEVVELKTSNPEYYTRLGVEDVNGDNAQGVLMEISRGEWKSAIISGNEATSLDGQYLRAADQSQSLLIDRSLDVSADPLHWVDAEVINIGSSQVADLEIIHPDGNRIRIEKLSADDPDFSLEGLPDDREVLSGWSVNSLANAFSTLRMDAVVADAAVQEGDPVNIRLLTFSGLEVRAEIFAQDDNGWIRIRATAPEPMDGDPNDELAAAASQNRQQAAEEINTRTGNWLYRLPAAKLETMTKRFEQLLKPLDGEQDIQGG